MDNNQRFKTCLLTDSTQRKEANAKQKPIMSSKELQASKTLDWLDKNFTRCPGVCLPRCIMYAHYLNFCQEHNFRPACAATFGKIIRQKFPELTTRRLGTRGNSKYHYYGVAIKETSTYYHTVYSGVGLTRFSGSKLLSEENVSRKILTAAKSGSLLPEFPSPHQLNLPYHVETFKMDTFMIMYRTHCQCILDTAVAKNYEAIHQYLVHFWQGIPKHLKSLFEVPEIVSLVCMCDSITFMVLNDSLVPATLEEITDQSLSDVRNFVNNLETWLQTALQDANVYLTEKKMQVARRFVQAVKRQTSFLHLAQSFREVLSDKMLAQNLIAELDAIDMTSIGVQAMYTTADCERNQTDVHEEYLVELKELLRQSAAVESYVEWLERIVKQQVLQYCETDSVSFKLRAQEFLLSWSFFGTRVMHMLTLNNSRTYGPFHLIRMMLDEYLLLITETRLCKQEQFSLQQESDRIIKVSDKCMKMSKFITKSKFGAPSKPEPFKPVTKPSDSLPPIASLQQTLKRGFLDLDTLPNDSFSMKFGDLQANSFDSLLALTPPSSPLERHSNNTGALKLSTVVLNGPTTKRKKTNDFHRQTTICDEDVDNLVDEHFRNCGVAHALSADKRNENFAGFVQKFLQSQNQTINPYVASDVMFEVSNDATPLQSSFNQILNSDVLLTYNGDYRDNKLLFADNESGQSIEEVFLRRSSEEEDYPVYSASLLEMSF